MSHARVYSKFAHLQRLLLKLPFASLLSNMGPGKKSGTGQWDLAKETADRFVNAEVCIDKFEFPPLASSQNSHSCEITWPV